jgi:serine/threonine protein kinase
MPGIGPRAAVDINFSAGTVVADKYRIVGRLGRGGMGIVYRAEDLTLKRDVALKFLPPDLIRDEQIKKRFIGEARTASALDHPNICTIFEIDETPDGRMFIAMACYGGETVKEKISRGPLGVSEAMGIAAQVAEALEEAHEKGIVHRDVKPSNLMVAERGLVKVMDFGLAKLADKEAKCREGFPAGTVPYMSPEQAGGEDIDYRTDLWALGVVLYEMLTGQQPHTGDNPLAVIYSILNKQPVPPSQLRPDIPRQLDAIILKLLERDRTM